MRRFFGAAVAAGAITLSTAPGVSAETLTDALIGAYKHSHILDQQRALLRAADEDVAVAISALRPVVAYVNSYSVSAANNYELSASYSLTFDLLLYDNGATKLAADATKEGVLALREALVDAEQSILLAAVAAYMDVISATETVQLRASNVRLINQELQAARDRFEVGEITRTDVALAESALASARSSQAAAQGTLDVAREAYRAAVGRYPKALSAISSLPQTAESMEVAQGVAVRTHPSIRQAQREVTVAELNIARAEAAMKLSITGSAGVTFDEELQNNSSVSLSLRQPIYQGGALSAQLRKAKAQRDAARAALLSTTHTVQQAVGNAWSNLRVTNAQLSATDRQISAATVAFRGVQEEARLGSRTTLDVLNAEQDLLDARVARVEAQSGRNTAVYQLLSSMGLLTVEHLGLGIQTYDPSAYYNAVKDAPAKYSKQGKQLDSVLRRLNLD
ncbi:TolC family outer membrane protein [Alphaproteobacteria bacterium KMM 3653]|uniref:TolC family outer membrane protein n=2 Tax=Harenicola maris TaxID=2841044 RepID=A0AAP2CRV0_9RHOB|nr:TolC family outer membrane protein [Harenicola maris]